MAILNLKKKKTVVAISRQKVELEFHEGRTRALKSMWQGLRTMRNYKHTSSLSSVDASLAGELKNFCAHSEAISSQ